MGLREMLSRDAGNNAALDGLRGAMCVWMIVFHSFFWTNYFVTTEEMDEMTSWPLMRAFVLPGYMAVDVFFVLTGYLLAGSLFRKAKRAQLKAAADREDRGPAAGASSGAGGDGDGVGDDGGVATRVPRVALRPWVYRRSMRVLPMLTAALLVWCFVMFPKGTFPIDHVKSESTLRMVDRHFKNETHLPNGCNAGVANVLFLNNLLPFGGCMGYTWTLAIQFHFYFLLPLLWNYTSPRTLVRVCAGAILLGALIRAYSQVHMVDLEPDTDELGFFAFFWYCFTLTRIGCICYGVILAYASTMHKVEEWFRRQQLLVWVCWGLAVLFMWGARAVDFEQTMHHPLQSTFEQFVSTVLHPGGIFMGAGITFMVMSIHHSVGPIGAGFNWLFSKPFWAPIAELSYIAYLLHPMVMQKAYATIFHPISATGLAFTGYAVFNVTVTLSAALVLHLLIDVPVQRVLGRRNADGGSSRWRRWLANVIFVVYSLQMLVSLAGHAFMLHAVVTWTPDADSAADVADASTSG